MANQERPNAATMKGNPLTLIGPELKAGDSAPNFIATGSDLSDTSLSDFSGKVVLLSIVPSLDTSVCAMQTRRFNQEAAKLSDEVIILTISLDLPFAQKRFCGAEGIDQVIVASDYKYRQVGEKYGVLMKELGLLNRSVFVIDQTGKIVYAQYVKENAQEPDYAPVLEAVKKAL